MDLNGITQLVKDLQQARHFYEDVLGFEPGPAYEPTRWQSYRTPSGAFFAIGEAPGSTDEVSFTVPDVEALWQRVKDHEGVVEPLVHTPWGTYRFLIRDPDGHLLAVGQQEKK